MFFVVAVFFYSSEVRVQGSEFRVQSSADRGWVDRGLGEARIRRAWRGENTASLARREYGELGGWVFFPAALANTGRIGYSLTDGRSRKRESANVQICRFPDE